MDSLYPIVPTNTMTRHPSTELADIAPNTPIRLKRAATLAFPDGSMTISGLRKEIKRGTLEFERIAGKDYTTLANIERMRELCRVEVRDRTYGFVKNAKSTESSLPEELGSL